ncbi:MAG: Lin0512 family protein [Pseudomonadota bacterium]
MMLKRLLTEFGMGSSLRRQDYTEAACRAVRDALWHNSINLAELFGKDKTEMVITVDVAVQQPEQVNTDKIAEIFPYGQVTVVPVKGGLDVRRADGGKPTVIANVAISVALDVETPS